MTIRSSFALVLALATAAPALAQRNIPAAIASDPAPDRAHPARMEAFVIPSQAGALNAVMYVASGAGPHPTLLLLHGFPGNEQNLDLAQAARRAGWNVLTFHYRGSWHSPGTFSFAHCAEDAVTAVAFLREAATVQRFAIDPARIAVAGHSMGGIMAARTVADDSTLRGAFLIDPADLTATARAIANPNGRAAFLANEVRGDLPPLAGTSEEAILAEIDRADPRFDLVAAMPALAGRPLTLIGADRGIGKFASDAAIAARKAGAKKLRAETWATDHSFSDKRIALASALVTWLATIG